MRLAVFVLSIASAGFAGSWSGYLVDSHCWASRNTNTSSIGTTSDRDMQMDFRYCAPTAGTRQFTLVLGDWSSVRLDAKGNEMALAFARNGQRHVTVNGTRGGGMITTGSVAAIPSEAIPSPLRR